MTPAPGTADAPESLLPHRLRLHLVGSSGAGKTTLGRALAQALDVPFVDLDDLFWEPGWQPVSHAELARRVAPTLALPGWVVVGNYRATTELHVWPRITHLVVLDLSFRTLLTRTVWRTLRRGLTGEPCCNGNREQLSRIFHPDGVVRYLLRNWRSRHQRQQRLHLEPALAHARVLRHVRSPSVHQVLAQLLTPPQGPP
jgi:adenylate kinase family enzyme